MVSLSQLAEYRDYFETFLTDLLMVYRMPVEDSDPTALSDGRGGVNKPSNHTDGWVHIYTYPCRVEQQGPSAGLGEKSVSDKPFELNLSLAVVPSDADLRPIDRVRWIPRDGRTPVEFDVLNEAPATDQFTKKYSLQISNENQGSLQPLAEPIGPGTPLSG